jgi:hypothetical protein
MHFGLPASSTHNLWVVQPFPRSLEWAPWQVHLDFHTPFVLKLSAQMGVFTLSHQSHIANLSLENVRVHCSSFPAIFFFFFSLSLVGWNEHLKLFIAVIDNPKASFVSVAIV